MIPIPLAVAFAAGAIFLLGAALGAWVMHGIAFDRGFEEALGSDRHRHRHGDPKLPRAGRLELEPPGPLEPLPPETDGPEWAFFSGAQVQPQPGRAEYELLTVEGRAFPGEQEQQAILQPPNNAHLTAPAMTVTAVDIADEDEDEPDPWTATGEIAKMRAETDEFIKGMTEDSNYVQHVIHADGTR